MKGNIWLLWFLSYKVKILILITPTPKLRRVLSYSNESHTIEYSKSQFGLMQVFRCGATWTLHVCMYVCHEQMEVNKKREAELQRLKRDLEESLVQSEALAVSLRKRHNDAMGELSEQCEALQRARAKLEKDKQNLRMEVDELATSLDNLQKAKVRFGTCSVQWENSNKNSCVWSV